jgi:hypothetical protein
VYFISNAGYQNRKRFKRKTSFHFTPGVNVTIFKMFSPKNLATVSAFLTQIAANYAEKVITTLIFKKAFQFIAENRRKSPKIAENRQKL